MDLISKDAMKEFLKCYLSSICFDLTFQLRTNIHIMIITIQLITLITMVILKFIFKDNQIANIIISGVCCTIVWLCCFLTIGISFIVKRVRKKNQKRIETYYKYLDAIVLEDNEKEITNFEDEIM